MNDEVQNRIEGMVLSNKVFLFMKGMPDWPQCGFSARVVDCLKAQNIQFEAFDVLTDDTIRQGIKEYANWPTIPQLYINGKFVGGCDITLALADSGELQKLISQ